MNNRLRLLYSVLTDKRVYEDLGRKLDAAADYGEATWRKLRADNDARLKDIQKREEAIKCRQ